MPFGKLDVRNARQPPRSPDDPDYLTLTVVGDKLFVQLTDKSGAPREGQQIALSEYNAWLLLGMIALFVGLKLPKRITRNIHM